MERIDLDATEPDDLAGGADLPGDVVRFLTPAAGPVRRLHGWGPRQRDVGVERDELDAAESSDGAVGSLRHGDGVRPGAPADSALRGLDQRGLGQSERP